MSIHITISGMMIPFQAFVFNGGEISVKLNRVPLFGVVGPAVPVQIKAHVHCAEELVELLMVTDAIRRAAGDRPIELVLPYLPYARQDRVCAEGEDGHFVLYDRQTAEQEKQGLLKTVFRNGELVGGIQTLKDIRARLHPGQVS